MMNSQGELVTSNNEIKNIALETFSQRLHRNKIKEELMKIEAINKKTV